MSTALPAVSPAARLSAFPTISIILLTLAAAAIHVSRAVVNPHITALFLLNALGYVVLMALLCLPLTAVATYRELARRTLIGYAGLTFVLFFVWGFMKGEWPAIGFVDKVIEAALIGLLLYIGRDETNTQAAPLPADYRAPE